MQTHVYADHLYFRKIFLLFINCYISFISSNFMRFPKFQGRRAGALFPPALPTGTQGPRPPGPLTLICRCRHSLISHYIASCTGNDVMVAFAWGNSEDVSYDSPHPGRDSNQTPSKQAWSAAARATYSVSGIRTRIASQMLLLCRRVSQDGSEGQCAGQLRAHGPGSRASLAQGEHPCVRRRP